MSDPWMRSILQWGSQHQKRATIEKTYKQTGSWEGWVRVELGALFSGPAPTDSGTRLITRCEVPSYMDQKRPRKLSKNKTDIVVDEWFAGPSALSIILDESLPPPGSHIKQRITLELVCESLQGQEAFEKGVRENIRKVRLAVPAVTPCRMYTIAFAMSDDGNSAMAKLGLTMMEDLTESNQCPFKLWYYCRAI
jgi:hypothetical protein